MGLKIFNVVIWIIAGITNLTSSNINHFSYALMWVALIILLVARCFDI